MKNLSSRLSALRKHSSSDRLSENDNNSEKINTKIRMPESWEKTGRFIYQCTTEHRSFNNFILHQYFTGEKEPLRNLVFFDLETTGLSGGAGTYAFLAGFGIFRNNRFFVKQIFMSDFPGEEEFIKECCKNLDENTILVSYNGKSFDYPLVRSKAQFYRLKITVGKHIDLLHPSRRLWKTLLENCSLSIIETEVLDIRRSADIPGIMIPDRYFSFLKSGNTELLSDIFHHHQQDILSLFKLIEKINIILLRQPDAMYSLRELGRMLLETEPEKSVEIFSRLLTDNDALAGRYLALFHKRNRNTISEHDTWKSCWMLEKNYFNAVEYAKCLEHKTGDYKKALEVLDCIKKTEDLSENRMSAIEHRIRRINGKLAKYT